MNSVAEADVKSALATGRYDDNYTERRADTPNAKWREFANLLSSPPLPALLEEYDDTQ